MTSNIGPLTTTFTPSSGCDATYVAWNPTVHIWRQRGYQPSWEACFPYSFTRGTEYYYSPGICPSGYTYNTQPKGDAGVSVAICCPEGYTAKGMTNLIFTTGGNLCATQMGEDTPMTVPFHAFGEYTGESSPSVTTTTLKLGETVGAWGVVVHRQENDPTWEGVEVGSSTPAETGTGSTMAGPSAPTANKESESNSTSHQLSSGVVAAICIGAMIGFLSMLGAMYAGYRIRKSKKHGESTGGLGLGDSGFSDKEFAQPGTPHGLQQVHEKGEYDRGASELEVPRKLVELSPEGRFME